MGYWVKSSRRRGSDGQLLPPGVVDNCHKCHEPILEGETYFDRVDRGYRQRLHAKCVNLPPPREENMKPFTGLAFGPEERHDMGHDPSKFCDQSRPYCEAGEVGRNPDLCHAISERPINGEYHVCHTRKGHAASIHDCYCTMQFTLTTSR